MSVIALNESNFDDEVLNADKPVLIDFYADWCGPCRMLGPIVATISDERDDIKVCKVNIDEHPELASKYNIMNIPALIVIKDGEIAKRSIGFIPKNKVLELLD